METILNLEYGQVKIIQNDGYVEVSFYSFSLKEWSFPMKIYPTDFLKIKQIISLMI